MFDIFPSIPSALISLGHLVGHNSRTINCYSDWPVVRFSPNDYLHSCPLLASLAGQWDAGHFIKWPLKCNIYYAAERGQLLPKDGNDGLTGVVGGRVHNNANDNRIDKVRNICFRKNIFCVYCFLFSELWVWERLIFAKYAYNPYLIKYNFQWSIHNCKKIFVINRTFC